jgi:hypothetical protein
MKELVWIPLYVDRESYIVDRALDWNPRADGDVLASEIRIK